MARAPWPGRSSCLLLMAPALLAGCSELSDRGVVARAGDWTLTEERLAELLVLAQPFPLDSAAVDQLADHWVAAAVLSQRAAAGDSLLGGEAMEAVTWAARREAILAADREERLGATVVVNAVEAEATHQEGSLRLVAQVLRRAGPGASSTVRLQQQRTADRLLAAIVEGGSWIEAVAESEDEATRPYGGVMGVFAPGELPSTLDRVAFRLDPGQVSAVTQSNQGFHIFYRPTFAEVEFQFIGLLRERRLAEADIAANEEARLARNFAVVSGAPATVARIAEDPAAWLASQQRLATWRAPPGVGGQQAGDRSGMLTAAVVARDFFLVPPSALAEWAEANPAVRENLVTNLGTREMRVAAAAARGMSLDPSVEESFFFDHADRMEYWTRVLELGGAAAPSRAALARHMDAVATRQEPLRMLPSLFEAWLLSRVNTRVRARGVLAAIVQAKSRLDGGG